MSGFSFWNSGLLLKQQLCKSLSNAENVSVKNRILHSVCFTCLQSSSVLEILVHFVTWWSAIFTDVLLGLPHAFRLIKYLFFSALQSFYI